MKRITYWKDSVKITIDMLFVIAFDDYDIDTLILILIDDYNEDTLS